ncbi:MAG: hypothetical protein IT371_13965 [Deltaproteobacteria bacterium]|nr:hypothetical protein [Deltaproteobacteria bacterium]
MTRRETGVGLALALALACGCKGSSGTPDAAPSPTRDAAAVDAAGDAGRDAAPDAAVAPDLGLESNLGQGCSGNATCKKGSPLCIMMDFDRGLGICSRACKPDSPATPLANEDDCPEGYVCGAFRFTSGTSNYCLKKCTPSLTQNPCPSSSGQTCHPLSTRYASLKQAVCWYLACKDGKDCPVYANKTCAGDPDCAAVASDAFCDLDQKRCARPGNCTKGGLCGPHAFGSAKAKVGDPCASDLDCPNSGACLEEAADKTAIGPSYHNGYCTVRNCAFGKAVPEFACPTGSTCAQMYYGGLCMKSCTLASANDCRGHGADKGGDYECYAYDAISVGGVPAAETPICMNAARQICSDLGGTLTCESFAAKGNPTNMSCRDRFTGQAKSNPKDPKGVCLDDTASGPFQPAPDGGTADAAVKRDAGSAGDAAVKRDGGSAGDARAAQ